MKKHIQAWSQASLAGLLLASAVCWRSNAADAKEDPIKAAMQKYHKAPKGIDTVVKKAQDGNATKKELEGLVDAYKIMAKEKPPKGDDASWKEKSGKLLAATISLRKGDANAAAQFKEAVNCKACHSVHKPD